MEEHLGRNRSNVKLSMVKLPLDGCGVKSLPKLRFPAKLTDAKEGGDLQLKNVAGPLRTLVRFGEKLTASFQNALGTVRKIANTCKEEVQKHVEEGLGLGLSGMISNSSLMFGSATLALAGSESDKQRDRQGKSSGDGRIVPAQRTNVSVPRGRRRGKGIRLTEDRPDEERVLISEILIKNKDGNDLDDVELLDIVKKALKSSKPTHALTTQEVQEDVLRIIDTGFFASCFPTAEDTRDGVRLVFRVEPNMQMTGLKVLGANVLPTSIVQNAFQGEYGKVVNLQRLDKGLDTLNSWYNERGLFGQVTDVSIQPDGVVRILVAEAEVRSIKVRFRDRKTGEDTKGKTRPETLLRQLMTKPGQVYSLQQGKRDAETVFTMGIMEDVNLVPQPADTGMVDLTMNVVERQPGGFSAGGGLSGKSIVNGAALSGLMGSFQYIHRNAFGRNQKFNIAAELGQYDSKYRLNYTDPWLEKDDHRTSRSINIQNSRSPGATVHGEQRDPGSSMGPLGGGVTIGRFFAGIDFSRPLRPKLNGTAGLSYQRAGARDDHGSPKLVDSYGSRLTFSGSPCDHMLVAKLEAVYTDGGDKGSSQVVLCTEQGLPIQTDWLFFNRINARVRQGFRVGPFRVIASFSGGTVIGDLAPHEAFPIGGTNSVRGYDEGAVGSGRSCLVGSGEVSFPLMRPVEGAVFADYGTDLGSGATVPGDPAGARGKPGTGYGCGAGVRIDSPLGPLRFEYARNDGGLWRFHFGIGYRS